MLACRSMLWMFVRDIPISFNRVPSPRRKAPSPPCAVYKLWNLSPRQVIHVNRLLLFRPVEHPTTFHRRVVSVLPILRQYLLQQRRYRDCGLSRRCLRCSDMSPPFLSHHADLAVFIIFPLERRNLAATQSCECCNRADGSCGFW